MNKLNNFPPVYYISLEDQHERQSSMNLQLDLLGIKDKTMVTAYDGRIIDYRDNELVEGLYFHQLDSGQIAVGMSHLKAIKEWYYNSNTDYAVFLEDDVTFESSQYWNFTWDDIVNHLPKNWKVIQLALIKEDGINEDDMKLHSRNWWNWSAGAYLITREYAKILINEYCDNNRYRLKINKDLRLIPLVENIIYIAAGDDAYTLPLFAEDTSHLSTFYPNLIKDTHKGGQIQSSQFILNWWKENGKTFKLQAQKTEEDKINTLLYNYIQNPELAENNYNLADYYENIGQTASAVSYYLRTAERTQDTLMQYECLLRASICFDKQGSRNFTVKGLLQNAISILPKRPEAYYLLAKFYSQENKDGCWNDCYLISTIAENIVDKDCKELNNNVSYSGFCGILYYKALSGWWCGLCGESKKLFIQLLSEYDLSESEIQVCKEYLNK
jgi:GR25 family glycosyltransferase involved in LPS biosynthesis